MSEITRLEIQKNNPNRANLYLDEKFFSGVSLELCIKHHLKVGKEIDDAFLSELILEDERVKAFDKAINYVSSTMKTSKQIRDYLKKKDYNPNTIEYVVDKMKEYKYLDDEQYARAFVSSCSNKYGKHKLMSALKSKGVAESIIEKVLEDGSELKDSIDKVAEKYMKNKDVSPMVLAKLSRFLYSRGFEFDQINSCVNRYKSGTMFDE
ncbi:MAG: RecX family transcriptional regulator [Clostridia bacterium]|nr:RecX family transcriptional regulator [Clostridia bacterium]